MLQALSYIKHKKAALDLGAGAMNDVRAMLHAGFEHVDIVDSNPGVAELSANFPKQKINIFIMSFQDFAFKEDQYDFINAQYALPFAEPEHFIEILRQIYISLKAGGVFAGNFFGIEDEWVENPNMTFVTDGQLKDLFKSDKWNIYMFDEERTLGPTADGAMKRWHLFNVIAEKKP